MFNTIISPHRIATATVGAIVAFSAIGLVGPASAQPAPLRAALYTLAPFGGATPSGYCYDLVNEIADRLGVEVSFEVMGLADVRSVVQSGAADLVCSPVSINRTSGLAYTGAIATNKETVLVPSSDQTDYTSAADLGGLPVIGTIGIVGGRYHGLAESSGVSEIKLYSSLTDGMIALTSGEIRAFIGLESLFRYQQGVLGLWPDVRLVDAYVSTIVSYPAIGVGPDAPELLGMLHAALDELKTDGTLSTLLEKWAMPAPPY